MEIDQDIFEKVMSPPKIKWWEQIFLFFMKEQTYHDKMENIVIKYKIMFGKYYLLSLDIVPPVHINCRSHITAI